MSRDAALAAFLACALAACGARQGVETRTPGITAVADRVQVTVQLAKDPKAGMTPVDRTVTVLALDEKGHPVGAAHATLPGSLRYACVPLTPAMKGAKTLVVTAEPNAAPETDPNPDPGKGG